MKLKQIESKKWKYYHNKIEKFQYFHNLEMKEGDQYIKKFILLVHMLLICLLLTDKKAFIMILQLKLLKLLFNQKN